MSILRKKHIQRFFLWAGVALLAVGWLGCGSKKGSSGSSRRNEGAKANPVVLRVESSTYFAADFDKYIRSTVGEGALKLGASTLSQLYDKFEDDKLLLQAAVDQGITLSPEEKQAFFQKFTEEGMTSEETTAGLASDSGPLIDRMKVEKYISALVKDLTVSDEEVRDYYERNKSQFFLPERMKVSQILLPTESKAVDVWEKLRSASEDDFRAMAKAESDGPEASEGGEMGVFQKGQLPPEMEASILSLQEGEISPIVESSYGFHIFRLDKKYEPEQLSLEQAAASIKVNIMDQKAKAAVSRRLLDLKEKLDWTAFPENLPFPYQKVD